MTLPVGTRDQVMLLPARTPAEASVWGSAAMEYPALFHTVYFSRDPARIDWRDETGADLGVADEVGRRAFVR